MASRASFANGSLGSGSTQIDPSGLVATLALVEPIQQRVTSRVDWGGPARRGRGLRIHDRAPVGRQGWMVRRASPNRLLTCALSAIAVSLGSGGTCRLTPDKPARAARKEATTSMFAYNPRRWGRLGWPRAAVSKTARRASVSWVQIPPPPHLTSRNRLGSEPRPCLRNPSRGSMVTDWSQESPGRSSQPAN
jgi:hypothetical protein